MPVNPEFLAFTKVMSRWLTEDHTLIAAYLGRRHVVPGWWVGVLAFTVCFAQAGELGFSSSVTPGLVAHMAQEFGEQARGRLKSWQEMVQNRRLSDSQNWEKLSDHAEHEIETGVNGFFNRVPFIDDLTHWGVEDYWATPAEFMASNGGDCEDFTIAKYFALKEIGVPITHLRMTYVKATRLNQAHMVLAYYPTSDAEPLILDNLENDIRPASERPDLIPVYSFNDDDVWLARTGERAGSPTQIRLWRGLLEKLEQEQRM